VHHAPTAATLPGFLAYFVAGVALLAGAMAVYLRVTPHAEIAMIRAGNAGAAIAFGGAMLGFSLPIASAFAHSINIVDAAVWALVALVGTNIGAGNRERALRAAWIGGWMCFAITEAIGIAAADAGASS